MGAKRQAKKEMEKERELAKLRAKEAAKTQRKEAVHAQRRETADVAQRKQAEKLAAMTPEQRKRHDRNQTILGGVVILAVLAGVGTCTVNAITGDDDPLPVSAPAADDAEAAGPDASAQVACEHFRNVVGDVASGLLTPEETREKIREVYDSARVSSEPGMAESAEVMMASVTQRFGMDEAFEDFTRECIESGAYD